jgi:GNAT superfamily N-acetyltransferase
MLDQPFPAARQPARADVVVRPALDPDLPAISEVRVRSWQVGYAGLLPARQLAGMSPAADLDKRRRTFADLSARIGTLVAEHTDAPGTRSIRGFANLGGYRLTEGPLESCDLSDTDGEIYALYVDPAHWRGGVGRALLHGCLRWLADHDHLTARLWVLRYNHRARGFYESAGFRTDGEQRQLTTAGGASAPVLRYTYGGELAPISQAAAT